MSIMLANFGKYAISDCPFIWLVMMTAMTSQTEFKIYIPYPFI